MSSSSERFLHLSSAHEAGTIWPFNRAESGAPAPEPTPFAIRSLQAFEEHAHNGLACRGQVRRVPLLFSAATRGLCAFLKLLATALWIAGVVWFFRPATTSAIPQGQEMRLRAKTEALVSGWQAQRLLPKARLALAGQDDAARTVIAAGLSASATADSIEKAVRHTGLAQVALTADDRATLYWTVFELLRRGYQPEDIRALLATDGTRKSLPDTGRP